MPKKTKLVKLFDVSLSCCSFHDIIDEMQEIFADDPPFPVVCTNYSLYLARDYLKADYESWPSMNIHDRWFAQHMYLDK